jgi:SOS-response transcriptional repressor LexA
MEDGLERNIMKLPEKSLACPDNDRTATDRALNRIGEYRSNALIFRESDFGVPDCREDNTMLSTPQSRARKTERFEFKAPEKLIAEFREAANGQQMDMADFARAAIAAAIERVQGGQTIAGEVDLANLETDSFRAAYLSRVPCGPLREALDTGSSFTISRDTADELEVREGDFWVRAEGESMEGAGIQDGFLILMRPLDNRPPRRGEIVLVQFFDEDGDVYQATVKRWNGDNPLRLKDGQGDDFEVPEGREYKAVAVARGVVGRV